MDGCTWFFNSFGGRSHVEVCDQHDLDYWCQRTVVGKLKADVLWLFRLYRAHWTNSPWQPVVFVAGLIGYLGLMTGGWWFWKRRHMWDDQDFSR